MKKLINIIWYVVIAIVIILCFVILFLAKKIKNEEVKKEEIYDVILFWGQSNMTGYAGAYLSSAELVGEDSYDSRLDEIGIEKFSKKTGINREILNNYTAMNHVNINYIPGTVYEFKYLEKELIEIKTETTTVGEMLVYNQEDNTLKATERTKYFSLQESYGTNLVSHFAKTYYELTGHKVIIVMASNGGEEIAHFLPYEDVQVHSKSTDELSKQQYIYESMVIKYNEAIKCLEKEGKIIGNRFYVVTQGEADVKYSQKDINDYETIFQQIHNNLKTDLNMQFGVIVETADKNGSKSFKGVEGIHEAQENIISKNDDIILGTSYIYKHFIPSKSNYQGKISYKKALANANLSVCISPVKNNTIHLNSAALSQIGLESAIASVVYMIEKN